MEQATAQIHQESGQGSANQQVAVCPIFNVLREGISRKGAKAQRTRKGREVEMWQTWEEIGGDNMHQTIFISLHTTSLFSSLRSPLRETFPTGESRQLFLRQSQVVGGTRCRLSHPTVFTPYGFCNCHELWNHQLSRR